MSFYKNFSKPRKTFSNTTVIERPSSSCTQSSQDDNQFSSNFTSDNSYFIEFVNEDDAAEPELTHENEDGKLIKDTPKRTKRKREDSELSEIIDIAKSISGQVQSNAKDINRTFADYVYSLLSNISPEDAKEKRRQIICILED
ncbi:unnamed protein product [Brassicogethes aeneus]|uniref:Uncharacterized protein n=1 Tax=Brassicogethes aeneus TaxID=1431903 RepID=A0A9P0FNT5_BRAAE|nr:unnamed protein product [Brassicogethes aeneus]